MRQLYVPNHPINQAPVLQQLASVLRRQGYRFRLSASLLTFYAENRADLQHMYEIASRLLEREHCAITLIASFND